ncbi:MAG: tetratricopeptide repeat protein, partial [Rubrivivax sp.]|nr:tetratricopeptide repeat protein [Rubrivivax sp.]
PPWQASAGSKPPDGVKMSRAARRHLQRQKAGSDSPWARGQALVAAGRWVEAIAAFRDAARAAPQDALIWLNLANAQRHAGEIVAAHEALQRCLKLDPALPLARRLHGELLVAQHRHTEALALYQGLREDGIEEADAMLQEASMLLALRRPMDAVKLLMQAAAMEPTMLQIHASMATAFRDMDMMLEAVECLRTVLALAPDNIPALAHISYEQRHLCEWSGFDDSVRQISESLERLPDGERVVVSAFSLLSLPLTPALHLKAACAEAQGHTSAIARLPVVPPASVPTDAPVHLGLLSYDFHEHPVSQLIVEALEHLDRSRFRLSLYSSGRDDNGSPLRARLRATADHFVDLRGDSDAEAADRIRADGVTLLVDLMGHTRGHRIGVLARKPAPIQAGFLGYPGSTGADFIDYIVSDAIISPLEHAAHYREKIAQLPVTMQPNGRWRPLPQPMSREQAGLPEDAVVLCAFNHTYKIGPEAFDAWCGVMRDVPEAVLWLKQTNPQLHDNVRREAAARGVDPGRILWARNVSYQDHFSRLALADIFVDTWPYNAHTTAADAVWAGLPVVTRFGESYASRVAASVLAAAGVGELAFERVEDYRLAITALALDRDLRHSYRERLVSQRMALPLFDTPRWTREFESLLGRMVARWRQGLAPDHLPAQPLP